MLQIQHKAIGYLDAADPANRTDAAIASNSVRMLHLQQRRDPVLRNQQSVSVFRMLRLQHSQPHADIATYSEFGRRADIAANQTDAVNATW